MLEQNLRRALSISNGELGILWQSGVTKTLLIMATLVIVVPPLVKQLRKRQLKTQDDPAS